MAPPSKPTPSQFSAPDVPIDPRARQAVALVEAGKFREAETLVQTVRTWGQDASLLLAMSLAKGKLGDNARAVYFARRAYELASSHQGVVQEFFDLTWRYGTAEDAAKATRDILASPLGAQLPEEFYKRACGMAVDITKFFTALAINDAALERFPKSRDLLCGKGGVLLTMGDPEAALVCAKDALSRFEEPSMGLHALMAAVSNYVCEDPAEVFAAHRACGRAIEKVRAEVPFPPRDPNPERPLRIGFISGDFYDHAVVRFLSSFLTHRDRSRCSVVCFMTIPVADDTTKWIRSMVDGYHHVNSLSQATMTRDLILKEQIDVLIDLAGLLPGQALEVMALRAAPVQLSMIGYPATTGITATDARVVDSLTDPPGADGFAAERLARIDPCFLCYTPRADAPPVEERPTGQPVVFGSFNSMQKHTIRTLCLWARVLDRVPGSRLIIKNRMVLDTDARTVLVKRIEDSGIGIARCDLTEFIMKKSGHLGAYGRVDIALDTFPYHGTTTTCEAMYMGVPVVSRVGKTHAARVGLSLLTNMGLADLAHDSDDAFVDAAVALAHDADRRTNLRRTLRERMLASPLCDAPAHTRRIESLIREEWARVCAAT